MINRREFLGSALAAAHTAGAAPRKKMNVIFVLADDLGWAELGCYGNRFNQTPNLDKLAARGVRFSNAYSQAPVCTPTRVSIITGQHPVRCGLTDFLRGDDPKYLKPAGTSLPAMLSEAGYATGLIGKWHLMGDYRYRKGDPKLHGFREVICSETKYIGPGDYFHPYAFMPEVGARKEGEYLTDRLADEAVDFIGRHKQEPFFLYLSNYAVHTRLAGKREMVERYRAKPGAGQTRNNPELAAMLESLDEGVGRIVAEVEKAGIGGNTAIVFASDNGGELNVTTNEPLHGGKSMLYEGGIRTPLIVAMPGFGKRGTVCPQPVVSTDLYPTFLEWAGVKPRAGWTLDGMSLSGAVRETAAAKNRAIYWHYPLPKPHFLRGRSASAVRQGEWKLIEFHDEASVELYNLREDPGEANDLAGDVPRKTDELQTMLKKWREKTVVVP